MKFRVLLDIVPKSGYLFFCNYVGEGTLPWAIFHFRIFSNYSQKFEEIKITV